MFSKLSCAAKLGILALGVLAANAAIAQDGSNGLAAKSEAASPDMTLSTVKPSFRFSQSNLASAGVGLRNRRTGAIELGDVRGEVRRAYLYWNLISTGTPRTEAEK